MVISKVEGIREGLKVGREIECEEEEDYMGDLKNQESLTSNTFVNGWG